METEILNIIIILVILYFVFISTDAISDVIQHRYNDSNIKRWIGTRFNNWFTDKSWQNKYIDGDSKKGRKKIKIFGLQINKPVQFTDFFHNNKMWYRIYVTAILYTPILILYNWIYYIILFVVTGVTGNILFSYLYDVVLIEKDKRR